MNLRIKNVERVTGDTTDFYWANVRLPNGRKISVAYDILNKNVIVGRKPKLDYDEVDQLIAYTSDYFEKLLEKEGQASA